MLAHQAAAWNPPWCCPHHTRVELAACARACAGDLKPSLSKALNTILQPVRDHFENNAEAKELLKKVKSYKVTK